MKNNTNATTSNKPVRKPVDKRLARIERYLSTHRGDLKKSAFATYLTPYTAGVVSYISGTAAGDTFDDRTGLVINSQRFYLGINYKMTTTASVRVVVFVDRFNQGAIPATGDILESADVTSPYNYSNTVSQKRFRVIYDKTRNFSLNGTLSDHDKVDFPLPMRIRYTGSSASSAFAGENSVFLLLISDTTSAGFVGINSRILFSDE